MNYKSWKYKTPVEEGLTNIVDQNTSDLTAMGYSCLNMKADSRQNALFPTEESCFYVFSGVITVECNNNKETVAAGDMFYLPVGLNATLTTGKDNAKLGIGRAATTQVHNFFVARFQDVSRDPVRHEVHGSFNNSRDVLIYSGKKEKTAKLILGVTTGQDGSWTSWPPHQHTETFEEIYVYFGMGDPGFALHLEITEDGRETAELVRDGDVVIVPKGYHPLVACPGTKLKYVFIMAAIKDGIEPAKYRELSLIHPEFLSHVTK